jgi:hypothetical protein
LAKEWSAGNRGGNRAGKTGLDESEQQVTIALRNQHLRRTSPGKGVTWT